MGSMSRHAALRALLGLVRRASSCSFWLRRYCQARLPPVLTIGSVLPFPTGAVGQRRRTHAAGVHP